MLYVRTMSPTLLGFGTPKEKRILIDMRMTEGEPIAFNFLVRKFMEEHFEDELKSRAVSLLMPFGEQGGPIHAYAKVLHGKLYEMSTELECHLANVDIFASTVLENQQRSQ